MGNAVKELTVTKPDQIREWRNELPTRQNKDKKGGYKVKNKDRRKDSDGKKQKIY